MDINQESLNLHYKLQGKIEVISRKKIETKEDLSLLYTPGVAQPCREIAADYNKSFELTRRNNLVAVITDGSAVLGLGDIGPAAGMPVMEGKCALFKEFADVDAFPICINSKDVDTIVQTIYLISQSFGGINLEDIAAPRCFEVEKRLKELCDIPVFHDDQHGTAIVVAAAMLNALKITGKKMGQSRRSRHCDWKAVNQYGIRQYHHVRYQRDYLRGGCGTESGAGGDFSCKQQE